MIQRVTEHDLIRKARELAQKTRREIDEAGLSLDDFEGITSKYGITLCWDSLPGDNPGCYIKEQKKIVLDPAAQSPERLNFTFFHELMHDRIEHDDDMLNLFADAYISSDEGTMERLCNAGAAELLIPSDDLQAAVAEQGFSAGIIPALCDRYNASSIAVAIKMVTTASHDCYLVIAEPTYISQNGDDLPMLVDAQPVKSRWRLVMTYTVTSPSIKKYSIKRGQIVPNEHPMYAAWQQQGQVVRCQAKIPFASGKGWNVDFDALFFRSKVLAFFNATQPVGKNQLRLF